MNMRIAAKHPFYGVEVRELDDPADFSPEPGDPERIYHLPMGGGMELGFLVGMPDTPSRVVRAGFHAAKKWGHARGHVFSPLTLSRQSGDAFILFADPTLTLSDTSMLSWYLGTADCDPDDWMEPLVRKLMAAVGADCLFTEGSSGGGFACMRFAARFHQSIAVPKIPQTDLFAYMEGPLAATLELGWRDWCYEQIMEECPHRFRIADVINDPALNNGGLIHYVQNTGDRSHVDEHLSPFLIEVGAQDPHVFSAGKGQISISRPFVGGGHIPIPQMFWRAENEFAMSRLRDLRSTTSRISEPFPAVPRSGEMEDARMENVRAHRAGNKIW